MFSLKTITTLLLLGLARAEDEVPALAEIPPPCETTDFLSADCSREVLGAGKVLKLTYWVTLIENVPTFVGQYEINYRLKSTHNTYDLRLCLELGEDGKELDERSQLMFHSEKTYRSKEFNPEMKILDPTKASKLTNY